MTNPASKSDTPPATIIKTTAERPRPKARAPEAEPIIRPTIGMKKSLPDLTRSPIQRTSAPTDGLISMAVRIGQYNGWRPTELREDRGSCLSTGPRTDQCQGYFPNHSAASAESM